MIVPDLALELKKETKVVSS